MIFFTADNHVGVNAQWGIKQRRDDFMQAFHSVCMHVGDSYTLDKKAALIIGGDLFDSTTPSATAVEFVQSCIRRLPLGVQVYGIDGNHDLSNGKWLEVCGIKPLSDTPTKVNGVNVCGISYTSADRVLSTIKSMAERDVKCDVLVLHLALGELNRMGAASDVTAEEMMPYLKDMGVKLVLIGHIHISQQKVIDGITFAYCGSTEVCSSTEPKEKSFLSFKEGDFTLKEVPIATRMIEDIMINSEADLAKFEATHKLPCVLYSVQVSSDIKDGVKRIRSIAQGEGLIMRVQTLPPEEKEVESSIDRSTGVIGLEGAIERSFKQDSTEADLVRTILRSPATMKQTVENYLKGENNDTKQA